MENASSTEQGKVDEFFMRGLLLWAAVSLSAIAGWCEDRPAPVILSGRHSLTTVPSRLTITGLNFGSVKPLVTLDGLTLNVVLNSATTIVAQVPASVDASSGSYLLTVGPPGPAGPVGATGPKGDTGAPGQAGVSAVFAYAPAPDNNTPFVTLPRNASAVVASLALPAGNFAIFAKLNLYPGAGVTCRMMAAGQALDYIDPAKEEPVSTYSSTVVSLTGVARFLSASNVVTIVCLDTSVLHPSVVGFPRLVALQTGALTVR